MGSRTAAVARLFVIAAAAVAVLAVPTPASAIANGTPVVDGQYPFSTKLTFTGIPRPDGTTYDSACSGALVDRWWVITAGHCFHDANRVRVSGPVPYPSTATVGRTDLSDTTGHVISIVQVRQAATADVALARLAAPADGITPIAIGTTAPKTGDILRLTGWGATSSVDPVPVSHLRTGLFTVRKVTPGTVGVVGRSPARDTSACLYDSGGPYFREPGGGPVLVSVESGGPDCPHSSIETTARVDKIAAWISTTIS